MENEIWVNIDGYDGYAVSNLGRVKSYAKSWQAGNGGWRTKEENICKPHYSKYGYNHMTFRSGKKGYDLRICRLVGRYFVPNPNNYKVVNHIDGIKANDYWYNLEWTTHKLNTIHAHKIGLSRGSKGEANPMSKITSNDVLQIRELFISGTSAKQLAAMYSMNDDYIYSIIKKRTWKHI